MLLSTLTFVPAAQTLPAEAAPFAFVAVTAAAAISPQMPDQVATMVRDALFTAHGEAAHPGPIHQAYGEALVLDAEARNAEHPADARAEFAERAAAAWATVRASGQLENAEAAKAFINALPLALVEPVGPAQ